jgi:hypothetical protein
MGTSFERTAITVYPGIGGSRASRARTRRQLMLAHKERLEWHRQRQDAIGSDLR